MIRDYSGFVDLIKEGSSSNPTTIYWKQQLNEIINNEWKNIKTKRYNGTYYEIAFESGEGSYNCYEFLFDDKEYFYVEDNINTQDIKDKLKDDFWKNAQENVKNLKYKPKFLGDLEYVEKADKYNL
jgi:hypothetical protein